MPWKLYLFYLALAFCFMCLCVYACWFLYLRRCFFCCILYWQSCTENEIRLSTGFLVHGSANIKHKYINKYRIKWRVDSVDLSLCNAFQKFLPFSLNSRIQREALCNRTYTPSNCILCFFFTPKPNYVRVLLLYSQCSEAERRNIRVHEEELNLNEDAMMGIEREAGLKEMVCDVAGKL